MKFSSMFSALCLSFVVSFFHVSAQTSESEIYQLDPAPYNPLTEPNADLFMRNWRASDCRMTHETLQQYDILLPLDSDNEIFPTENGNVLTVLKRFNYGVIAPGETTDTWQTTDEQNIYYIIGGEGKVISGGKETPITMDTFIVIPPGISISFENTCQENFTMIIITEYLPEGFKPREDILVRNIDVTPLYANRGHWTHCTRGRLTAQDGLATLSGMCPVWYMPDTIGQPHSHPAGVEEVWYLIDGDLHLLLGKQFYNLTPGTAYKVPPTGSTPHSNMSFSDKPVKMFWMMNSGTGEYGRYAALDPEPYDFGNDAHPDMFISSYKEHSSYTTHGSIIERDILTKNTSENPIRPTTRGTVLNHLDRFTYGTLMSGQSTYPTSLEGIQEIFYILNGMGSISAGGKTYALYPGVCFMVPEGLEFSMHNTSKEDMTMYIVAEKTAQGFIPRNDLVWRDSNDMDVTFRSHWTYDCTQLIGNEDGLSDIRFILMVTIPPHSFGQPHSHRSGTDEGWIAIDEVNFEIMIGKHLRTLNPGEAYLVPPDGKSFHANINLSDKPIRLFYFGRF